MTRNKKLEQFAKQAQRKLKVSEERMTKILNQGVTSSDTIKK
jgi:ribosomal protein S16